MAKPKNDDDVIVDAGETMPVLEVHYGRGQTGKSIGLRWTIDRARNAGRQVIPADGDRANSTLSSYYKDAVRPTSTDDADVQAWLTGLLERMVAERCSVALDLGGGDLTLETYARAFPLVEFCAEYRIRPVLIYFVAPNIDSLAPVDSLEESGAFRPRDMAVVLNEGLVPFGQQPGRAFDPVKEHPVFRKLLDRGAEPIMMPKLGCMADLEKSRLGFFDSAAALGPTRDFMVRHWRQQMEEAFTPIRARLA